MVVELRKRKEKPAPVEAPPKRASKKTDKRKATEDASPIAVKKQKSISRPETQKKTKEPKKVEAPRKAEEVIADEPKVKEPKVKEPKVKAKKAKKAVEEEKEENADEEALPGVEEGDEVDDQTKALVKALDSGDDGDEGEEGEEENAGTYKKGQDVGKAPKTKTSGKVAKTARLSKPEDRGTIYVGHVPFGFFEHQMREYFSQFGDVTRIRLSRNKKTGASKHYGFVEFADAEVAEIVAKTMDKYLLFGCILAVRVVPPSQIHPDLWNGANRRWKTFDRNAAQGRQLVARAGETQWNERVSKEEARRAKRAEKLKELGYEFEAPKLKAAVAKDVPAIENGEPEPVKAIEAAPATTEPQEADKAEEAKTGEQEAAPEAEKGEEGAEEATKKAAPKKTKAGAKGAKATKGKKAKS